MLALYLLPERECTRCTAAQQRAWGCFAERNAQGAWENKAKLPLSLDGEDSPQCPRRPIKDDPQLFRTVLTYHSWWLKGFLPDAGGITDQSARGMTLLTLVDQAINEARAELQERARRKSARLRRR